MDDLVTKEAPIDREKSQRARKRGWKWIPFCIFPRHFTGTQSRITSATIGRRERGWRPLTCVKIGPHFRPCLLESHFSHLRTREWMEACDICVCQLHNCVPLDLIQEACIHKKRFSTSKSRCSHSNCLNAKCRQEKGMVCSLRPLLPAITKSSQGSQSFLFVLKLFFEKLVFRVSRSHTTYRRYFDGYRYETKDFYLLP